MILEVRIERVGVFGEGVGHDGKGNAYFVPGTIPGDLAVIESDLGSKRYREARLVTIKEPSAERKSSVCPYFGQCGGCDWLEWDYSQQLKAKENMVRHALSRAGLEAKVFSPIYGALKTLGYRNRIQVRRSGDQIGFYQRRSHTIVDVKSCAVTDPRLNSAIAQLRTESPPAVETKTELALGDDGEVLRWENQPHASAGFVQINPEQNLVLQTTVAQKIKSLGASSVLELFAGNGNLTFSFAPFVSNVLALEGNALAVKAAGERVERNHVENVSFVLAHLGPYFWKRMGEVTEGTFDTLVLDPPRCGAGFSLAALTKSFRSVLYVSCSPVSFCKDVAPLVKEGFVLEEIQPIDMFPHTRHIELVATLKRPLV